MTQRNESTLLRDMPFAPRAALYMRVSTGRQAEHDLSIPDQRNQLQSWCRRQGYDVVAEFVEPGASAADDRRPVFQQMIERACDGEHAFGFIVVHSDSRFFRESFEQEFYLRQLAKHGVKIISITQPVDETDAHLVVIDPNQMMVEIKIRQRKADMETCRALGNAKAITAIRPEVS